MTDELKAEPKIEYAQVDDGRVTALLHIIDKASGHTPKLSAIASEAMLELEAINATVVKHRAKRTEIKEKAEREAKAKRDAETARQIEEERKKVLAAKDAAAADAEARAKVAAGSGVPVTEHPKLTNDEPEIFTSDTPNPNLTDRRI
jgi:hypothetical protein